MRAVETPCHPAWTGKDIARPSRFLWSPLAPKRSPSASAMAATLHHAIVLSLIYGAFVDLAGWLSASRGKPAAFPLPTAPRSTLRIHPEPCYDLVVDLDAEARLLGQGYHAMLHRETLDREQLIERRLLHAVFEERGVWHGPDDLQ